VGNAARDAWKLSPKNRKMRRRRFV